MNGFLQDPFSPNVTQSPRKSPRYLNKNGYNNLNSETGKSNGAPFFPDLEASTSQNIPMFNQQDYSRYGRPINLSNGWTSSLGLDPFNFDLNQDWRLMSEDDEENDPDYDASAKYTNLDDLELTKNSNERDGMPAKTIGYSSTLDLPPGATRSESPATIMQNKKRKWMEQSQAKDIAIQEAKLVQRAVRKRENAQAQRDQRKKNQEDQKRYQDDLEAENAELRQTVANLKTNLETLEQRRLTTEMQYAKQLHVLKMAYDSTCAQVERLRNGAKASVFDAIPALRSLLTSLQDAEQKSRNAPRKRPVSEPTELNELDMKTEDEAEEDTEDPSSSIYDSEAESEESE